MNYTLSILKPDITSANKTGAVNAMIEDAGFTIVAQKLLYLDKKQAEEFYNEHSERPFFASLVEYMTSGRVIVQVLYKSEDAVLKYRKLMGSTNPKDAEENTIRNVFGQSIEKNAVHGSDSIESARREIDFFFSDWKAH